jgi:thiamine pyrophosphokinase
MEKTTEINGSSDQHSGTAVIYANGQYPSKVFAEELAQEADSIICADGGLNVLGETDVIPDLIIGDLDSADPELVRIKEKAGSEVRRYSSDKDLTDTQLAVEAAIEKKAGKIILTGVSGGRIDHGYGNLFILNDLGKRGIDAEIREPGDRVFLLDSSVRSSLILDVEPGTTVSVLAFSDQAEGVVLRGFQYPIDDRTLGKRDPGYGVSNVTVSERPEIRVRQGILLVDIVSVQVQ